VRARKRDEFATLLDTPATGQNAAERILHDLAAARIRLAGLRFSRAIRLLRQLDANA
jgi:hypothetical protein